MLILITLFEYNTIQYNTIQYNTIQYNTIQYNTIQYNTIQYNTIQYNTIQYNTICFIEGFQKKFVNMQEMPGRCLAKQIVLSTLLYTILYTFE